MWHVWTNAENLSHDNEAITTNFKISVFEEFDFSSSSFNDIIVFLYLARSLRRPVDCLEIIFVAIVQ